MAQIVAQQHTLMPEKSQKDSPQQFPVHALAPQRQGEAQGKQGYQPYRIPLIKASVRREETLIYQFLPELFDSLCDWHFGFCNSSNAERSKHFFHTTWVKSIE
mmetsp:Transcript_15179/g.28887  ORF Transcript_15179/g.28887 Transcript_15179/m.28887 type:complete len:103 (-) Transcript_15179:243-551(-)